ncbi:IclR family transcriptional regulator [Sabulicella glaciei]|uniref:IclR family transcriptional regulator n=1 Tax=Sabulicella glaciei TaxID=2984948 RepID=A0ABT3NQM6_9PROT|nr:IclR family transcriptional regulator [Roseococcus sp. MDT2-1-1]MCW8084188.1 IclR family transcriptional regulator [Roseococcus sp. MDT2-1-1]
MTASSPPVTNAVQKVCAVLRALSGPAPMRLTAIAEAARLNKVTALRILETLTAEGFVQRVPGTKTYALGREALVMAAARRAVPNLAALAAPGLLRLAAASGDTALLSVRSGTEAAYIAREVGDFPMQPNILQVGTRRPLGVGASSLGLLAWLPEAEAEALLEQVTPRLEAMSRLPLDAIRAEMAAARKRGYLVLLGNTYEGMGGVSVPVRGPLGDVVGAFSLAGTIDRMREREAKLATMLQREAAALSALLAEGNAVPPARKARRA